MQTYAERAARLEALCSKVSRGAARVRATGERVVKKFATFDDAVAREGLNLRQLVADKVRVGLGLGLGLGAG